MTVILYPQKRARGLDRHDPKPAAPVTLHIVKTREITDQDLGLPHDPVAQQRAETWLRAVHGHQRQTGKRAA